MFVPVALLLALAAPALPSSAADAAVPPAAPPVTTARPAPPADVGSFDGSFDGFVAGHVALGAGTGLAALSTAAFVAGFDIERQLRLAPHDRAVVDVLLLRRAVAAGVAWPAAVLAVAGVGAGVVALVLDPVRDAPPEAP